MRAHAACHPEHCHIRVSPGKARQQALASARRLRRPRCLACAHRVPLPLVRHRYHSHRARDLPIDPQTGEPIAAVAPNEVSGGLASCGCVRVCGWGGAHSLSRTVPIAMRHTRCGPASYSAHQQHRPPQRKRVGRTIAPTRPTPHPHNHQNEKGASPRALSAPVSAFDRHAAAALPAVAAGPCSLRARACLGHRWSWTLSALASAGRRCVAPGSGVPRGGWGSLCLFMAWQAGRVGGWASRPRRGGSGNAGKAEGRAGAGRGAAGLSTCGCGDQVGCGGVS